jgi:hypothetical protein
MVGALMLVNVVVGMDSHNQIISQLFGFTQKLNVAHMKQIEPAVHIAVAIPVRELGKFQKLLT